MIKAQPALNAILGILTEVVYTAVIMLAAFLICLLLSVKS